MFPNDFMIHQEQLFQQSSILLSVIVPHKHVKATQKQLITHLNQNRNKNKKTYQYVGDNFVAKFHARTQRYTKNVVVPVAFKLDYQH